MNKFPLARHFFLTIVWSLLHLSWFRPLWLLHQNHSVRESMQPTRQWRGGVWLSRMTTKAPSDRISCDVFYLVLVWSSEINLFQKYWWIYWRCWYLDSRESGTSARFESGNDVASICVITVVNFSNVRHAVSMTGFKYHFADLTPLSKFHLHGENTRE